MDTTILNDKKHRDMHVVAGLTTLIKCYGVEHAIAAASDLMEFAKANDIHNCPQGQKWSDALQRCVDNP